MNLFLIGMSGIGMQGLAIILKKQGNIVNGFDDSEQLELLKKEGIQYLDAIPENTNYVIYSSAIKEMHPLMISAKELGIKCVNRTDFLINYMQFNKHQILVAGAHGKTTTSSVIAYLLNLESYLLGGIINSEKFAAHHQESKYTTIETDESDGSFMLWAEKNAQNAERKYKILLNFDFEHMDYFKTEKHAIECYQKFIFDDIENSTIIIEKHAYDFLKIEENFARRGIKNATIITYSSEKHSIESDKKADFIFSNIQFEKDGARFKIYSKKNDEETEVGTEVFLPLIGEHNASNFTAVFALLDQLNIRYEDIATRLAQFPGIKKRMQKITTQNGFTIFSDYGHHPKEVECVLKAFDLHKKYKPDVIIEPHRYTRLQYTWNQWPDALRGFNVYVTPIHTASESEIPGITVENFIQFLQENGVNAKYLSDFSEYDAKNDTICFSAGKLSSILSKY